MGDTLDIKGEILNPSIIIPKVSVIIPIYNMAAYLDDCLDSVFRQSLKEVEVICINDGSTDDSAAILKKWQDLHSNMLVLVQENLGTGRARNLGIDAAQGEFIAFMDADDFYVADDALELLYDIAVKEKVYICGGNYVRYHEGTFYEEAFINLKMNFRFEHDGQIQYRKDQRVFGFWRYIYNRKMILSNGIRFPNYKRCQDPPFLLWAMIKAKKFYGVTKVIYAYRNTDKVINFDRTEILADILMAFIDMTNCANENRLYKIEEELLYRIDNVFIYPIVNNLLKENKSILDLFHIWKQCVDYNKLHYRAKKIYDEMPNKIQTLKKGAYEFNDQIKKFFNNLGNQTIIIYGAGKGGQLLYTFLCSHRRKNKIIFAISKKDIQVTACERKVYFIDDLAYMRDNASIIISVKDNRAKKEMTERVTSLGFTHIETWDVDKLRLVM